MVVPHVRIRPKRALTLLCERSPSSCSNARGCASALSNITWPLCLRPCSLALLTRPGVRVAGGSSCWAGRVMAKQSFVTDTMMPGFPSSVLQECSTVCCRRSMALCVHSAAEGGSTCRNAKKGSRISAEVSDTRDVYIGKHMVGTPGFGDNRLPKPGETGRGFRKLGYPFGGFL